MVLGTCVIWGSASYVNSWVSINILVILISMLAIAAAYSFSSFFGSGTRAKMRGFVRFELIQLVVSIAILGLVLGLSATACSISAAMSNNLVHVQMNPFQYADYYIGTDVLNTGLNLLSNLYATSVSYSIYALIVKIAPTIELPALKGAVLGKLSNIFGYAFSAGSAVPTPLSLLGNLCKGTTYCGYASEPSQDMSDLFTNFATFYLTILAPIILIATGLMFIQFLALPLMQYSAFTIVLPVALAMRSISFFGSHIGDASNALIAIAIAFYIIYPMMVAFDGYAIAYVFSANNPSAQYAGGAFTVNTVTPFSFFQASPSSCKTSIGTLCSVSSMFGLLSFEAGAIKTNWEAPGLGLFTTAQKYINDMAQFVFQSVLLFALDVAVTVGLAMSIYKALRSGLGEAGRFW